MRDYALERALNRDSAHAFPTLRRLFANWFRRRSLRRVEELDDHILRDIGVSRDDLRAALRMPLEVDPYQELQRRLRRRPYY